MSHDNEGHFHRVLGGIFNRVPFPNGAPLELTKASSIPSFLFIVGTKLLENSDDSF